MGSIKYNPTEAEEQITVISWAKAMEYKHPELALLHHCPNGGSRHRVEAARLKAQGVKAGVPDLFLPVARNGKHGLFIEMKRRRGGRIEPEQKKWIAALLGQGYEVYVCKGADAAIETIKRYLEE